MHYRKIFNSDHELFRSNARRFFREELEPNIDRWEQEAVLPREFWQKAGAHGFHCCSVPEEYGGAGADFLYNMVLSEEVGYAIGGASVGFSVSSDIVSYYLLHNYSLPYRSQTIHGDRYHGTGFTIQRWRLSGDFQ